MSAAAENDPRVQAIRCSSCHRLRPHPRDGSDFYCLCGGRSFEPSFPHDDELVWAVTIYERELREAGLWRNT